MEKKKHPIDFFGPYSSVGLTELTVFWPNMGTTAGGFLIEKLKKNDMSALFLGEWTLFDKKWAWEQRIV